MNSKGAILASPLLCLGVLAAIAADNASHVRAQDAAPFHARARTAVEAFPYVIGGGTWTGKDEEVPKAAVQLLRPNALVSRSYINQSPDWNAGVRWADLLISQCKDSRDMTGHYPPICYPSNGEPEIDKRPFKLFVNGMWINGVEYRFTARPDAKAGMVRKSVYNFFVVPGKGVVPDISDVREAAANYQRRVFGAAQFQVVMDADLRQEDRDKVFITLIGADPELIGVLDAAQ
ncbi:MAG: hypothetical protein JWL69_440 [Phycisphaerales bacterium]|nr:hypothetical protein [Phycisphaerales bacterium]MDB5357201.1 hypothetical protein [Phycisphaerales bacterium]